MTHTEIIARAMQIGALPTQPTAVPIGTRCLYTGAPITHGYAHEGRYISEPTARVLLGQLPNSKGKMVSAMWNRGSIVCLESGAFYWPMQSPVSAEAQGRIAWRDVLPLLWSKHRGEKCAIVATTDVKKSVWDMYADGGVGVVGHTTPVVVHVPSVMTGRCVVDWERVLSAQRVVVRCRAAGYSRVEGRLPWPLLQGQLGLDYGTTAGLSYGVVKSLQSELREYVGTTELIIALIAEGYSLNPKDGVSDDE